MQLKNFEPNNFHMIPCSHGKKRETSITILPEEIIFNILIRLPARVLYDVMRCVCRQWHRIIEDPQFVSAHLLLSTTTLLMYSFRKSLYHLLDVDVNECHAKFTDCEFHSPSNKVVSTCNGLMLIVRRSPWDCGYYVGNPITRRTLALPPFSSPIFPYRSGLAFEVSSKVYKAVVLYNTTDEYRTEKWFMRPFNLDLGCAILTVGADKAWRLLNCAHLIEEDMRVFKRRPPITSTGFIYWVTYSGRYILALDLKSESIKRISLPYAYGRTCPSNYLAKGNSISVWYVNLDLPMEVWLLKDYVSEEWVKFLYIDGEPIRNELGKVPRPGEIDPRGPTIVPRSWLGNGEIILFHAVFGISHSVFGDGISHWFVYDFKSRVCRQFALENCESFSSMLEPSVNSLAWV